MIGIDNAVLALEGMSRALASMSSTLRKASHSASDCKAKRCNISLGLSASWLKEDLGKEAPWGFATLEKQVAVPRRAVSILLASYEFDMHP